ncbi:MAG TPA: long-chain fatty acid--CoA ligase [Vicinamibacterales bacterium]|nr:long-chain fatty acid--CoA ligase [Vicinamibacterales bacterium]
MQLGKLVQRAAERSPMKIGTIGSDGRGRTWVEVRSRVAQFASALHSLGVRPGDRVGLLALNSDRYLECLFAAFWADAVIVPMNTRWSAAENRYCVADCSPTVLLVDEAFDSQVEEIRQGHPGLSAVVRIGEGTGAAGDWRYEDLLGNAKPAVIGKRGRDDTAGIFYTGGTTGHPKGVMLSHGNLLASSSSFWLELGQLPEDVRYLHAAPMFHLADASQSIGVTLLNGTHAFLPTFEPHKALDAIASIGITDTVLVPTMLQRMIDHPAAPEFDLRSLSRVIYGGSPMSPALLRRAQGVLPAVKFVQCYGQTEMAPVVTVLGPHDHEIGTDGEKHLSSVGKPAIGIDVQIVDDGLNALPQGQVGQVAARGNNAMLGYWNKPEQTNSTIVGGWVLTGDAGYFDADGYLYLLDRVKDMIITGGENVYSIEVENALSTHPGVRSAAVIGVPSERWGESVHAFVLAAADACPSVEELISHCKAQIAGYKCPKSIDFVGELPLSAAGKVLKSELRKPYWTGARRIN